jgi:anti-sigma factor RsiW
MKCDEIRERMPDVAAGMSAATVEENQHLSSCGGCASRLEEFRRTMALLDEWPAPEPSPYFDVRLQARLREEMAKPESGWVQWFRRPVLATALTLVLGIGGGLFFICGNGTKDIATVEMAAPGTAVSDLQALDKNHDLYSDFELLDDLEVQHDVVANP